MSNLPKNKKLLILLILLAIGFFYIVIPAYLIYIIFKSKLSLGMKIASSATVVIISVSTFVILATVKEQKTQSQTRITESNTIVAKTPANPTQTPEEVKVSSLQKIEKLSQEKYTNFELTVWNKDDDLAKENEVPYEVILNGLLNKPVASDCEGAKKTAYYMLEELYKDNDIRPSLSRVLITIPNFLRVSLGSTDGTQMADKGVFSGPTNFWTVMESMGLGEDETGDKSDRTWGNYLAKCKNS
jgi:hypothetical protein